MAQWLGEYQVEAWEGVVLIKKLGFVKDKPKL